MFRTLALRVHSVVRQGVNLNKPVLAAAPLRVTRNYHESHETDDQFDERYEAYFNRKDIDGWEVRKGMDDLIGMDLIPEPRIVIAAMKACRRINDYAVAVRFLEAIKCKCGEKVNEIYPYIINEIQPTLTELGIETPEQLGYDKPELALKSVHDL